MLYLWEILVPISSNEDPCKEIYWKNYVRKVANGLTIMPNVEGQWVSPNSNKVFTEIMTPVRIACTLSEINQIADFTASHYDQESIMFYRVSDMVMFKNYGSS